MSEFRQISLSKGQVAIVDAIDYEELSAFKWHAHCTHGIWYAMRKAFVDGKRTTLLMHRVLMNVSGKKTVDHINGNGLDNRRANLRLATYTENNQNRGAYRNNKSGYKGVSPSRNRWRARIKHDGKLVDLGTYTTPEDAAIAYNCGAIRFFGEFAVLNKVFGREVRLSELHSN